MQDRQGQAGADGGKGFVDLLVAAGGGADTAGGSRGDTAEGAKAAVVAVLFSAGGSGVTHRMKVVQLHVWPLARIGVRPLQSGGYCRHW